MPDREKVIKGLKHCTTSLGCFECPYSECDKCTVECKLIVDRDAIELLKEQPQIVLCKDCKYNDDNECIIKAGWFPVKPDWFCADGVKKDD